LLLQKLRLNNGNNCSVDGGWSYEVIQLVRILGGWSGAAVNTGVMIVYW
jgi:hypothetical protein